MAPESICYHERLGQAKAAAVFTLGEYVYGMTLDEERIAAAKFILSLPDPFYPIDDEGCCPFLSGKLEMEVSVDEDGEATVDVICAECAAGQAVKALHDEYAQREQKMLATRLPAYERYGEPPIYFAHIFTEN